MHSTIRRAIKSAFTKQSKTSPTGQHHPGREVKSNAYAIGRQYEGDELKPFIIDSLQTATQAGILEKQFRCGTLLADTNYFSEANCRFLLEDQKLKAIIPDRHFRSRDPRFPAQKPTTTQRKFHQSDFLYDPIRNEYRCPNGNIAISLSSTRASPHPIPSE